jgi:hypothetical protein
MHSSERNETSAAQSRSTKKSYRAPQLTFYGDVTQVTRGNSGPRVDGGSGMSKA